MIVEFILAFIIFLGCVLLGFKWFNKMQLKKLNKKFPEGTEIITKQISSFSSLKNPTPNREELLEKLSIK
jgi:hypothetical protein